MNLLDLEGKKIKEINLPSQFNEEYHPNLIWRAVVTLQSNKRQPYGADPEAGKRASAKLSRKRRDYKTAYGKGISRVPRKTLWKRGSQFGWVGANAPGTVGGRKAHPPKAAKILIKKINKKENRKAIRSALSAVINKDLVIKRNHKLPSIYPIAIENKFEDLSKTKDIFNVLKKIGLQEELSRLYRKVRAGKGKSRGRKYRTSKGPLLVVSDKCKLLDSAKNIVGIDIVKVNNLNAELLAPGTHAGRLTIFTEKAIHKMEKENLFM
jgi:large subunit ribosomal protein L4e